MPDRAPPPAINRDLVDVPVYTPAEYTALLVDFRRRLEGIVSYARGLGALPILILPPGNDTDFEPNRSFLPADTQRWVRGSFRLAFLAAHELETTDPSASMKRYQDLIVASPALPRHTIAWPSCSNEPALETTLTSITSKPGIMTATRCAA